VGKVKSSLNEEGCINCDLLYSEREPLATSKLCSTCVREGLTNFILRQIKEKRMSNHETEAYLENKFQEGLDKGMNEFEAEKYARNSLLQSDIFTKMVMETYEERFGTKGESNAI